MTSFEAYKLVGGYLASTRCTFQGLNEAVQIADAMKVLDPSKAVPKLAQNENPKPDAPNPPGPR